MFAMQLALTLFACGGETPDSKPDPAPAEAPAPDPEPAAEPAAAKELPPLEVTLEDNQKTCLGDADCKLVDLDCCACTTRVAANKGSADAVEKKFKRAADMCTDVTCEEACLAATAKCVEFKCAVVNE